MEIIDAQVHLAPDAAAEQILDAMDKVGVDAALIVNQSKYGPDNRRQIEAATLHPRRFAVVAGAEVARPDIEQQIESLEATDGVVGVRIVVNNREIISRAGLPAPTVERLTRDIELWESGAGYAPFLKAMERFRLPLCAYMPGRLREFGALCRSYPDLTVVMDHLNLIQHPRAIVSNVDPFAELDDLVQLAKYPNLVLKATALPTVSLNPFPYSDLWPRLSQIIEAFGPDRVMWGSDWTQVSDRSSYAQSVDFIRETTQLTTAEKDKVMGQSLRRIFDWPSSM